MDGQDERERFFGQIEAHQKILFKIARSYCRRPADRDDLVQEITLQLWRSYRRFDGRSKFSTWMYRVALNVAISFSRREAAQGVQAGVDGEIPAIADDAGAETEDIRLLYQCIEGLDALNKAVLLLYLDGNSHQEIAEVLGISATNVGTKIGRLKQQIREQFNSANHTRNEERYGTR